MEIRIDPKTGKPQLKLNESEVDQDRKIKAMMQTEGWKILRNYYEIAREQFIELGKNGVKTRAKRELSSERWAQLIGFDEFLLIPERIVERLKEYDAELDKKEEESRKKEEGESNEDQNVPTISLYE